MAADSSALRFSEAMKLLDYGFSNYDSVTIGKKGDLVASIPIEKGEVDSLSLVLERDCHLLITKTDKGDIEKEIINPESVEAPINRGDKLGELVVKLNGEEVDRVDLLAEKEVGKASVLRILKNVWNNFLFNK